LTEEAVLKVRKKGITVLPKRLRDAAGIEEDTEVRAKLSSGGILLRPLVKDPVGELRGLFGSDLQKKKLSQSSVTRIRKLRRALDKQARYSKKSR